MPQSINASSQDSWFVCVLFLVGWVGWGRRRTSVSHPRGQYSNPMCESNQHAKPKPPHVFRFQLPFSAHLFQSFSLPDPTRANKRKRKSLEASGKTAIKFVWILYFWRVKEEVWWVYHIKFLFHHALPLRFFKIAYFFVNKKTKPNQLRGVDETCQICLKNLSYHFSVLGGVWKITGKRSVNLQSSNKGQNVCINT